MKDLNELAHDAVESLADLIIALNPTADRILTLRAAAALIKTSMRTLPSKCSLQPPTSLACSDGTQPETSAPSPDTPRGEEK